MRENKRHMPCWHRNERLQCKDCVSFTRRCHKGYPLNYKGTCTAYEKRPEEKRVVLKLTEKIKRRNLEDDRPRTKRNTTFS